MTPKEKAKQLVDKYLNAPFNCKDCDMPYCDIKCTMLGIGSSKIYALIAVDEILESHYVLLTGVKPSIYEYWQEVKQEIEKL